VFYRSYPIRLRAGVAPERLEALRAVLEAAPDHIPGFLVSELVAAPEGSSHDLVWNNVFTDEAAFWLYAGHPYHANLVNDHLAPDAPASVKAASSTGTLSSDEGPVDPARFTDVSRAEQALEEAGISAPVVHLVEHIDVVPGRTAEYLDAVERIYLPLARRHDMRLLASWQSPPATGEEELVFVWAVPGWGAAFRSFVAINGEVETMQLWLDTVRPLRSGGRRRYLLPTSLPGEWTGQDE
jgi:hypothetical protein